MRESRWKNEHPNAQVFTIAGRDPDNSMPPLQVPLQHQYIGSGAIPSSLASIHCTSLGVEKLLCQMNKIIGTEYTLYNPSTLFSPFVHLLPLLTMCIEHDFDLGTAYAHLRPQWDLFDGPPLSSSLSSIERLEQLSNFLNSTSERMDVAMRQNAINDQNQVVLSKIPPRRVWDLYSNRVVPYWATNLRLKDVNSSHPMTSQGFSAVPHTWTHLTINRYEDDSPDSTYEHFHAISHAWMDPNLRRSVSTPINGYEWPVPIPVDTTLERIRIELLNYGLEYVWLDVLCLRQEGVPEKEDLRVEEWKIDVPTIGSVYRFSDATLCYLSGLGRPFEGGSIKGEYHWFNRAWTLQESRRDVIIVGRTEPSPNQDNPPPTLPSAFYKRLQDVKDILSLSPNVSDLLNEMVQRSARNELDKISGLAYPLKCKTFPVFMAGQDPELAWERLVEVMSTLHRGQLFFGFLVAGDGQYSWYPSWSQVSSSSMMSWKTGFWSDVVLNGIDYVRAGDKYILSSSIFEGMLDNIEGKENEYIVTAGQDTEQAYIFLQHYHTHIHPGHYTFIFDKFSTSPDWVVGKRTLLGFRKICSLELKSHNGPPVYYDSIVLI